LRIHFTIWPKSIYIKLVFSTLWKGETLTNMMMFSVWGTTMEKSPWLYCAILVTFKKICTVCIFVLCVHIPVVWRYVLCVHIPPVWRYPGQGIPT
jgi:hypothetical protein